MRPSLHCWRRWSALLIRRHCSRSVQVPNQAQSDPTAAQWLLNDAFALPREPLCRLPACVSFVGQPLPDGPVEAGGLKVTNGCCTMLARNWCVLRDYIRLLIGSKCLHLNARFLSRRLV